MSGSGRESAMLDSVNDTPRKGLLTIEPLPAWLDRDRLLGPAQRSEEALDGGYVRARLELSARDAAVLAARLRGLGFDGTPLALTELPAPGRSLVREARLIEARARRE